MAMALPITPVSEISASRETWSIIARVVRLWVVSDFTKHKIPFSIEMVLMDEHGDRIHASVKRTLVYKFVKLVKEGSVYSFQFLTVATNVGGLIRTNHHAHKLNFQISTEVQLMDTGRVLGDGFELVPISDISGIGFDTDFLVDVIGMLTGVGTEREYERNGSKTKLNVISLEDDGHRIECTLFGPYVDELNTFLASGEIHNVVVIVQFAKVKAFQDKNHLQNCMSCTKILFNPTCDAATKLRQRMAVTTESPSQGLTQLAETGKISMEEEFLELTPRNTIEGLKNCKQAATFVVYATVKEIITGSPWWYTACICSKAVYPDSNMYFCEKCYKHVIKVFPRYCIKVRVHDSTGNAIFVIFEKDGAALLNKTASELFEAEDKISGNHACPSEICDLLEKSFLFKVEYKVQTKSQFEQSFRVKKICSEVSIINKFKEMMPKSLVGASHTGCVRHGKGKMIDGFAIAISEDLMPKFASAVLESPPPSVEMQFNELKGAGEGSSMSKPNDMTTVKIGESLPSVEMLGNEVQVAGEGASLLSKDKGITPVKNVSISDLEEHSTPITLTASYGSASETPIDLSTDDDNLTPLKRVSPIENMTDLHVPIKMLKKTIKIEKD